jgi:hypothetical protein
MNNSPTLSDLINEGNARLHRINSDQVFLGDLITRLFNEIVLRDNKITELSKVEVKE